MNAFRRGILVAVLIWFGAENGLAKDGLEILKSFENGGLKVSVANYTKGENIVGLLGIKSARGISFSCGKAEWQSIMDLWRLGVKTDSKNWCLIGSLTETNTTSPSHLVLYGGPAMQLIIMDPSIGASVYTFKDTDKEAFGEALMQAELNLTERKPK